LQIKLRGKRKELGRTGDGRAGADALSMQIEAEAPDEEPK
jgi:hypothetical protein